MTKSDQLLNMDDSGLFSEPESMSNQAREDRGGDVKVMGRKILRHNAGLFFLSNPAFVEQIRKTIRRCKQYGLQQRVDGRTCLRNVGQGLS